MKRALLIICYIMTWSLVANDNYAVTITEKTKLLNPEGYLVQELAKGEIIKIKPHPQDRLALNVNFEGETYIGARKDFRVIVSLLQEEINLVKDISILRQRSIAVEIDLKNKTESIEKSQVKLRQLKLWLEVQRDNALSQEYYDTVTQKTRVEFEDQSRKNKILDLEKIVLAQELQELQRRLAENNTFLKNLREKLKSPNIEQSSLGSKESSRFVKVLVSQ